MHDKHSDDHDNDDGADDDHRPDDHDRHDDDRWNHDDSRHDHGRRRDNRSRHDDGRGNDNLSGSRYDGDDDHNDRSDHYGDGTVHATIAEESRDQAARYGSTHAAQGAIRGLAGARYEVGVHAVMTLAAAISVPAVGIRAAIEANVNASSLAAGAGHYPGTGWPGQGRTIGLAGHDVTFVPGAEGGHVFHRLIAAKVGERVYIRWHGRLFVYRITGRKVVPPTTVGVLRDVGYERLVMTTCYPPGSAAFRLVTFARRDTTAYAPPLRSSIHALGAGLVRVLRRITP